MKWGWLVFIIMMVFGTGFVLSLFIIHETKMSEVNLVALNEVVKKAEKDWGRVTEETFTGMALDQSFAVIDREGTVIYQSAGNPLTDIYEALQKRATIVDLERDNEMVGKLIITNNDQEAFQRLKEELVVSMSVILSALFVSIVGYLIFLYKTLLKPFQQLQTFAANVARGHLDVPIRMTKNNYFGAFTESFDLMREELDAARQREYESNRSKKELVATLSHDIQTPVASIKAVSELMLLQTQDEKVRKHVNTISVKAEQIHLLVTDMFHATLEELQQLTVSIKEETSELLAEMIENVNYDEQIVCEPIPPCILLIDPLRTQQVLDNIITNAYKYAGTKIVITSRIWKGFLELQIQDFGPGISEEELPLLFNKYFRGKNVGAKRGSGLGLYISKYFLEHMGGNIHCSNRPDGFTVVLAIKLA